MHENRPLPPTITLDPPTTGEMVELWRSNRQALADDHRATRTVATGKPAHMKIELTNYCNLACPMCPHQQMTREVGYMKPELYRRIIDLAVPELEFAYLHHLGESLFHGKIGDFIRYGRARGVAMGLSTNATYLDHRKGRALLESGLDFLVISMDGASPDTYDRIRVGGDFATTVRNVRAFFELKRRIPNQTTVVVQMIVTADNRHEVAAFAELWRGDGAQVMIKEARDWAGQVKLVELGKRRPPSLVNRGACKMLWTELTVLWDGAVVPCVNVYERENLLGDLSRQTLEEVWNGPTMQGYRAAHAADAVDGIRVCNTCPRHTFDHRDFIEVDQLRQRIRNYVRTDLTPQPGLS
jgi:radical SAM protein with 4Fe4S-binding SPASM domain